MDPALLLAVLTASLTLIGATDPSGAHLATSAAPRMEEYCNEESFRANCGPERVVVMRAAQYGRMQLGRCVKKDLGYVGCSSDVLHIADHLCSGRHECEFRIPDLDKYRLPTQTCLDELKAYLEASYTCEEVHTANKHQCQRSDRVKVGLTRGHLASVVSEETGCGTGGTPWVIEVQPGQHVNITLLDFSLIDAQQVEVAPGGSQVCHAYAIIRERDSKESKTICGGITREQHVYLSSTNSVEVRLFSRRGSNTAPRFLMVYQAEGCADPVLGDEYKVTRLGKVVEVSCSTTGESWRLVCNGKTWNGQIGNCTRGHTPSFGQVVLGNISLSFEISVVIITVIASLISICILIIGVICLRRKRAAAQPPQSVYQQRQTRKSDPYDQGLRPTSSAPVGGSPPSSAGGATREGLQPGRHDGNEYACILEMPLPPPPPGVETAQEANDASFYETRQRAPPTLQRLHQTKGVQPPPPPLPHPPHIPHQTALGQEVANNGGGYQYPSGGCDVSRDMIPYEEDPRYFELDPENVTDSNCNAAPALIDIMAHRGLEERDKYPARFSK